MENSTENSASPAGIGGISRRRALTAAGGVLAGAALAQTAVPAFATSGASSDADAIVVGHGRAGLVATAELAAAGRKVLLLDQEPESNPEVAGFGGGGVHGYRSLEGTFLGGCLFSGRTAGRAAASATAT